MVQGSEAIMNGMVKLFDKASAIEAIKHLNEEDLRFLNRIIIERIEVLHKARYSRQMLDFSIGDRVAFVDTTGETSKGIVSWLNRKTLSIIVDGGMQWNVSPCFLKREDAVKNN